MFSIFHKPYFEYNLIDTFIITGLLFLTIVLYYGIRLAILYIQVYIKKKNKRK